MNTNFIHHSKLKNIQLDLPKELYSKINLAIKTFKLSEINEAESLREQQDILYKRFSLKAVEFSEPKIINHTEKKVRIGQSFENIIPYEKNIYEIEIEQNFTGSVELFNYLPNGFGYSTNCQDVYIPTNNLIKVYIDVEQPTKAMAIKEFENKMQLTYNIIRENNNNYVNAINKNIENDIRVLLNQHIEVLNNLYS